MISSVQPLISKVYFASSKLYEFILNKQIHMCSASTHPSSLLSFDHFNCPTRSPDNWARSCYIKFHLFLFLSFFLSLFLIDFWSFYKYFVLTWGPMLYSISSVSLTLSFLRSFWLPGSPDNCYINFFQFSSFFIFLWF